MKKVFISAAVICVTGLFSCGDVPQQESKEETLDCKIQSEISYSKQVVPILEKNCYECHNDDDYAKKADGHKLMGYDNVKKKVDEKMLKGSILHSKGFIKMPYRRQKLDTCDIAVIIGWIDQGAKNN